MYQLEIKGQTFVSESPYYYENNHWVSGSGKVKIRSTSEDTQVWTGEGESPVQFQTTNKVQVVYPKVTPVEFKLLFTSAERVALKNHVDPTVQDFMELVNDPRLDVVDLDMTSVQDGINYCMMVLAQDGVITDAAARVEEILSNVAK